MGAFRRTMGELLAPAWPIVAAMAGETLMGVVDTKLVSGLGPSALGGVGVAMMVAFLGYLFTFGLMRGVKVSVAHALGEGRGRDGVRYAQAGIALGLTAGAAFWALTRDNAALFRALRIDASLVPFASSFLATFTWGAPAAAVVSAMTHYRQAMGDSRTPMTVSLAGNVVNAWLGWSLIYGHGGLPALGVGGGAAATAVCESLEALVLVLLFAGELRAARRSRDQAGARPRPSIGAALRDVAALGVPTGLQFASEMLAMVVFTAILADFGPEQAAAHQIALATIRTSFLPGVAISEAASVLVGRALGRRSLDEADRVTRAAVTVAALFMTGCGLVFAIGGGAIARAFSNDPIVVRVARRLLWIAALFQTVDAIATVFRGTLRGAKDVRVPALLGVVSIWVCVPTAAIVLGRIYHRGAAGGWIGFLAETTLSALLFSWRWRAGAWRHVHEASTPTGAPTSDNPGAARLDESRHPTPSGIVAS